MAGVLGCRWSLWQRSSGKMTGECSAFGKEKKGTSQKIKQPLAAREISSRCYFGPSSYLSLQADVLSLPRKQQIFFFDRRIGAG